MIRRVEDSIYEVRQFSCGWISTSPLNRQDHRDHRIEGALPTIRLILDRAKKLVVRVALRQTRRKVVPKYSLRPVRDHLEQSLKQPVWLAPDCIGPEVERMVQDPNSASFCSRIFAFTKKKKNDTAFSKPLPLWRMSMLMMPWRRPSRPCVNFGMAAFFKQKGAGLLLHKELDYLSRLLSTPEKPFVTILGGAKVSDKIGVIRNLLPKVNILLIGGGWPTHF